MATRFKLIFIIYLVSYLVMWVSWLCNSCSVKERGNVWKSFFPIIWVLGTEFGCSDLTVKCPHTLNRLKGLVWILFFSKPGINNFQAYTISKNFILSSAIFSVLSMSNICRDLKHGHEDNIFNAISAKEHLPSPLKQDLWHNSYNVSLISDKFLIQRKWCLFY